MTRVAFHSTLEPPWTGMEPVRVGRSATDVRAADRFVTVEAAGCPPFRVDLHRSDAECFAFEAACVWSGFVVIGWSHQLHLVDLHSRRVTALELGGYFGHLYPEREHLLAASADRLLCVEPNGALRWRSDRLGIDGVIVEEIRDEVVFGRGEWDPPGGWRPFSISLRTGQVVEPA